MSRGPYYGQGYGRHHDVNKPEGSDRMQTSTAVGSNAISAVPEQLLRQRQRQQASRGGYDGNGDSNLLGSSDTGIPTGPRAHGRLLRTHDLADQTSAQERGPAVAGSERRGNILGAGPGFMDTTPSRATSSRISRGAGTDKGLGRGRAAPEDRQGANRASKLGDAAQQKTPSGPRFGREHGGTEGLGVISTDRAHPPTKRQLQSFEQSASDLRK